MCLALDRLIVACIGISEVASPERAENRNVRGGCQQALCEKFYNAGVCVDNPFIASISCIPKAAPLCNNMLNSALGRRIIRPPRVFTPESCESRKAR